MANEQNTQNVLDTISNTLPLETQSENTFDLFPKGGLLEGVFSVETAIHLAKFAIILFSGLIIVAILMTIVKKLTKKRVDDRTSTLIIRIVQYVALGLVIITALEAGGVNLSGLLGAAGIAGIALGFAAQTSVSNFISGFFLMSEKTFTVGDILEVDGNSGVVSSIDTMSIKLQTFDNRLIRIPNETLIKANVINITRFPVRRLNIDLVVTYDNDIEKVQNVLLSIADKNRFALKNPKPYFMANNFGKNGIELFFGLWFAQNEIMDGKLSILKEIQRAFKEENINFAYPTMTVLTNESTKKALPKATKKKI